MVNQSFEAAKYLEVKEMSKETPLENTRIKNKEGMYIGPLLTGTNKIQRRHPWGGFHAEGSMYKFMQQTHKLMPHRIPVW